MIGKWVGREKVRRLRGMRGKKERVRDNIADPVLKYAMPRLALELLC